MQKRCPHPPFQAPLLGAKSSGCTEGTEKEAGTEILQPQEWPTPTSLAPHLSPCHSQTGFQEEGSCQGGPRGWGTEVRPGQSWGTMVSEGKAK